MLFAVDIGNSNIVFGVFEGDSLLFHFRMETRKARTEDEYAALLHSQFALYGVPFQAAPADLPLPSGATPPPGEDEITGERHRAPPPSPGEIVPRSRTIAERGLSAGILATVVPPVLRSFHNLFTRYLGIEPVIVGPGTRTGMPILYDNPREVGADRIINAVAAYHRWPEGAVVFGFGTAT